MDCGECPDVGGSGRDPRQPGWRNHTLAAVAGGAVGARFGVRAIPARWLEALRQRERIEQVARGLYALRHQLVYSKPTLPGLSLQELKAGCFTGATL